MESVKYETTYTPTRAAFLYKYKALWIGWVVESNVEIDRSEYWYDPTPVCRFIPKDSIIGMRIGFRKKSVLKHVKKICERGKNVYCDERRRGRKD